FRSMRFLLSTTLILLFASVSLSAPEGENVIVESPSRTTVESIVSTTKATVPEIIEEGSGAQSDSKDATVPVMTPAPTAPSSKEEVALITREEDRWDLSKMMGRWFEAINTPADSAESCVVRNYGGLKKKTKRFTLRKMLKGGPGGGSGGPAGFLESKLPVAALPLQLFGGMFEDKLKLEAPVQNSIDFVKQVSGADEAVLLIQSSQHPKSKPIRFVKHGPEFTNTEGETQYEYIIMSNQSKYPVTVLVRDIDTFKQKYEKEVFVWLQENGFINDFKRAFNLVKTASYSTCEYTEATYEQYGM
ncbi:hypothetical protein PENTCL1PPCAC_18774, partial [Pristionchus entomophagus]